MPAEAPAPPDALTPGERGRLVPSLSSRTQLDELERLGIHRARVWAMRRTALLRDDLMTEGFARELHRRMFGGIWRGAGKYRITERVPGWEPDRIAEGVGMFFDDAEGWIRFSTYGVHEAAVRLHQRLLAIHPWANGNGRHARLVADVVVAAHGEKALTWGSGRGDARALYAGAIRAADDGDMAPMLEFARS
jgi:Fic-DOC domain mobile mystery protein B